jgi:hypothetical protein
MGTDKEHGRPMSEAFDHGPRLSHEEYVRGVYALQEGLPATPSAAQEKALERAEFDLRVDHRLGTGFPAERREALWSVHERAGRRRFWLMLKYLARRFRPWHPAEEGAGLAQHLVDAYAEVLSRAELVALFGQEEVENPTLPVDEDGS